jgi:hypothetical protein
VTKSLCADRRRAVVSRLRHVIGRHAGRYPERGWFRLRRCRQWRWQCQQIVRGGGNDELTGGNGGDLLDGGTGENTARYDTSSGAVHVSLVTGIGFGADAQGDALLMGGCKLACPQIVRNI